MDLMAAIGLLSSIVTLEEAGRSWVLIVSVPLVSGTIKFRYRTIDFLNLGIHLKSVGDHITVFGFDSAYYGIVIGIGILAGLMMAVMEAKRTHQNVEDYNDLAIYGVIFSIIGARAYYVIFCWDMYKDDIKSIINIREGGLAIYGGVITAIVVVFIFAKIKGLSPFLLFDTGGFGLITGQMIGRWGNFFNREAFGEYANGLFAMRLPVSQLLAGTIVVISAISLQEEKKQQLYKNSPAAANIIEYRKRSRYVKGQ